MDVAWDELDPRAARLAQARLALHHAVQLVAAEGRPYWYAAPWAVLPGESLPALAGGGSWHLEGWTGAELPIERLARGAPAQRAQVGDFFRSAMAAAGWPATARAT